MNLQILGCLLLILSILFVASDAATFQPFVRSRYSVRQRLTTVIVPTEITEVKSIESSTFSNLVTPSDTNADLLITTTSETIHANEEVTQPKQDVAKLRPQTEEQPASKLTSTEYLKGKTSTLPTDYDYYGNGENEESELNEI